MSEELYPFGVPITEERLEDEPWYYSEYQPFLEFVMGVDSEIDAQSLKLDYLQFHKELFDEDYDGDIDRLDKFCEYHSKQIDTSFFNWIEAIESWEKEGKNSPCPEYDDFQKENDKTSGTTSTVTP